jgi:hypothetical protein
MFKTSTTVLIYHRYKLTNPSLYCQRDILGANLKFPNTDEAVSGYSRVYSFVTKRGNECCEYLWERSDALAYVNNVPEILSLLGVHIKAGCALCLFCTRSVERNVAELAVAVGRAADQEPSKYRRKGCIPPLQLCRQGRKLQPFASLLLTEDLGSHKGLLECDAV